MTERAFRVGNMDGIDARQTDRGEPEHSEPNRRLKPRVN
jgi:hypothetical protein